MTRPKKAVVSLQSSDKSFCGLYNNKNKRYPLPLLLLIAFCASISKHDSWYTIQDYALAHEASIRELYKT